MFIDTHSHLAWDIDDGMDTKEHASQALELAKLDGIDKIIATPHFIPGNHTIEDKQRMGNRMQELAVLAKPYGIDVYTGCEIFLNHEYMDMIESHAFYTLNDSRYVLVEFDVRKDITNNENAEDILYELRIRKYTPVIAHVERYFHDKIDVDRIQSWIDDGYIIQVNRTSILGMHGERNEHHARLLLKRGLVHIVGSDAHDRKGNRVCKFSDVYGKIEKRYGKDNAQLLCCKNPLHILENKEVEPMKITPSLLGRIFGKGV